MKSYQDFAGVYDMFQDNIPYGEWCEYLAGLLRDYGIEDGLLLELGCGTGNITRLLEGMGYDMIGLDNSPEMLEIAMDKKMEEGSEILYLLQDMREFELYGTVRAVVSVCDSINYVTEPGDLLQVFHLVNNYLDPGGLFIFDLNTLYKYKEILGDGTFAEDREEASFIWDNYFDEEENINEYYLSLFIREESEDDGLYRKYEETHRQRAYTLDEIKNLLEKAGMEFVTAYDAFTRSPVREDSERICVIAWEKGKNRNKENTHE